MMRRQTDLVLIVACSLLLVAVILAVPFAQGVRIVLGLPFILFFPGYALLAVLFPRRRDLDPLERIALSLGLSVAVVPLIGLALNYSPWGIQLYSLLAFITLFIVLATTVTAYVRWRLPEDEAFDPLAAVRLPLPHLRRGDALLVLALVPLAAAIAVGGYFVTSGRANIERYTEFYVLGPDGTARSYPSVAIQDGSSPVLVGLVNHEGKTSLYRIAVRVDGRNNRHVGNVVLADGERWEQETSVTPGRAGDSQKVEFLLYRDGEAKPYRALHLWLDVEGAPVRAVPRTVELLGPPLPPSPTATPPPAPAPSATLAESQAPAPEEDTPDAAEAPQTEAYRVRPGDNLTRIARLYEVPLQAVIVANPIDDPDLIYPNQEIVIPPVSASGGSEE